MLALRTEHFITSQLSRCVNTKRIAHEHSLSPFKAEFITAFAAARHRWHTDCAGRLDMKVIPTTKKQQTISKQPKPVNAYGNPRGLFEPGF